MSVKKLQLPVVPAYFLPMGILGHAHFLFLPLLHMAPLSSKEWENV